MEEIGMRRSIRKYTDKKVSKEVIMEIINDARLAPSGDNTQPWNFIVVTDSELKKKLAEVDHNQHWMEKAPVFIVCVADISCRIKNSNLLCLDEESPEFELKQIIRDTSNAIENLLLSVESKGLGACWTGWYKQKDVKPILNIPEDKYVCGIIPVGYPGEKPKQRPRRKLEDMVYFEKWGEKNDPN